ncbi:MAG: biotin carboxylase N-terminal domain-containing protein [Pseudomonadales bacterium]|jgi:acetyl/propionyl-CoA carboxylase alpha subunit|nr:biotin carboxylase N-terminal domain-containing protein [Pseudomonadales bacterium]MDP6472783.1 biotin carboxylase N-terminal domain-containing protein [Pseudomonadales bacterium]MDP6827996.1 biotin carboxylase N-terminal domain-containing protein [Pseudomonadales bacterium]MDP6972895.1 biotin carboxylase N-terminal domain-containing protein [Pseudomonadales bacterium]
MADVIKPITKLLIANRGEIARRIIRTAHDMGIATVAIYADADADAPFVHEANTAIALNGRTTAETYLDMAKVLDACRRSGADAIHPGYGFLSENQSFAQAVIDAGIHWIGPNPEVIAQMGDKLSAKKLMQEADVPTLPAIEITESTDINAAAAEIGYPVLVKASAGGGGRGMRVVENENELADAVAGAKREAGSSFGDDTVFLEKWLATSRHVEMQILGDTHGNVVHCFERECSIQRRHQKIIEEAPSPAVTDEVRSRMGDAAIAAATKLGYSSAGTVEFLLSGDDFWFLEVNARLQVEHPVTEEIIGHDLVREQIRVAEGETLSFLQEDLSINGHAIEARLYAEDPQNGFLPSPGTVAAWEPSAVGNARFDSGVETGSEISTEFDPMIAKVTVHAPTRREAAARLARVLETTRIQGLTTNRDFLVTTLRTPEYLAGDTTTDFIDRVQPALTRAVSREEQMDAAIAIVMESQARNRAAAKIVRDMPSGWRNSTMPMERIGFSIADEEVKVEYASQRDGSFRVVIDETTMTAIPHACGDSHVDVAIDGRRVTASVDRAGDTWMVQTPTGGLELIEQPRYPRPGGEDQGGGLMAPMPGAVLKTEVAPGDTVEKGQLLLILEAMKMEHRITAPRGGMVEAVHVDEGDQVENGQLLVTISDEDTSKGGE